MTTSDLKKNLIERISSISDIEKLQDILIFLDLQNTDKVYVTNDDEKLAINKGLKDIEENKVISDESLQAKVKQWLEK